MTPRQARRDAAHVKQTPADSITSDKV